MWVLCGGRAGGGWLKKGKHVILKFHSILTVNTWCVCGAVFCYLICRHNICDMLFWTRNVLETCCWVVAVDKLLLYGVRFFLA